MNDAAVVPATRPVGSAKREWSAGGPLTQVVAWRWLGRGSLPRAQTRMHSHAALRASRLAVRLPRIGRSLRPGQSVHYQLIGVAHQLIDEFPRHGLAGT